MYAQERSENYHELNVRYGWRNYPNDSTCIWE